MTFTHHMTFTQGSWSSSSPGSFSAAPTHCTLAWSPSQTTTKLLLLLLPEASPRCPLVATAAPSTSPGLLCSRSATWWPLALAVRSARPPARCHVWESGPPAAAPSPPAVLIILAGVQRHGSSADPCVNIVDPLPVCRSLQLFIAAACRSAAEEQPLFWELGVELQHLADL